jgi:probable rRNA maturation factor
MPEQSFQLSIHPALGRELAPALRRQILKLRGMIKKCHLRELSVALVSDAEMHRLHKQFLGINTTTDVLTFEIDLDARGNVISGEVVICVPQARRQALDAQPVTPHASVVARSLANEVLLLALHGLLHLSGFDDKTARQFTAMHRAEDRLLSQLGVGPVFGLAKRTQSLRTDKR